MRFSFAGTPHPDADHALRALEGVLRAKGHESGGAAEVAGLVINNLNTNEPKSYRRSGRAVFVLGVAFLPAAQCTLRSLYPLLVRTLSNLLVVFEQDSPGMTAHVITPENGHIVLSGDDVFDAIHAHVEPLATARLVIDNIFEPDLEPALRQGDEQSAAVARAGRYMESLDLLPAPFPLEQLLSAEDMRYLRHAYGIGGLSYGNFSARQDAERFWMSASGVDKSKLETIGRDILLVTGYDEARSAMRLSVPPDVEPRRASVDAIEHWLIYAEQPTVNAIVHVHAWMDGIESTQIHYPCGTLELARAVADVVKAAPDPSRAIVGLKNHGLTITGTSMEDILSRIEGRIIRQVPFS